MEFFLESKRLKFRCWRETDAPLAIALWGDAGVMRYMGGAMSAEEAVARLEVEMERQRRFGVQYWPMFERTTNEFAGCAGLRPYREEAGVLEMGVHIAPPFWSVRLGEEAARAVMGHAYETLRVKALVAGHGPGNMHSKALVERLGFDYTHEEPWGPLGIMHPFYRRLGEPAEGPLDASQAV